MQTFKSGDSVLTLQQDGSWQPAKVVSSDGLGDSTTPFPYAIYIMLENGTSVITSPDHVFWLGADKLKRADRIAPTDKLLTADQKPIGIKQIGSGVYYGPIWNITATNEEATTPFGHLVDTAGVISADWALQRKFGESPALQAEPQVDTPEYRQKYALAIKTVRPLTKTIVVNKSKNHRFVPHVAIDVPADAIHLLPKGDDVAKSDELYPFDFSVPYEMGEYLVNHYRTFYGDVTYQIDWLNNDVNAVAFIRNGKRHVVLYGGLLRHVRIQSEGAGLVIAHELGHHYGGPPRYPNNTWASCEGQADYWGAKIAQRKVWWGEYSFDQTSKGALQLRDLFANGLMPPVSAKPLGICSHPPAQCRYDTYIAGMDIKPKPACAGDPSLKASEK